MTRASVPLFSSYSKRFVAPVPDACNIYDLFKGSDLERTGGYYNVWESSYYQGQLVTVEDDIDLMINLAATNALGSDALQSSVATPQTAGRKVTPENLYAALQPNQPNLLQGVTEPLLFFGFFEHDLNTVVDGDIDLTGGLTLAMQVLWTQESTPIPFGSVITQVQTIHPDGTSSARLNGVEIPAEALSIGNLEGTLFPQEDKNKSPLLLGFCVPSTQYLFIGRALSEEEVICVEEHYTNLQPNSDIDIQAILGQAL